jgi:isoquinoline 1-oxidoreductase subunit alpha
MAFTIRVNGNTHSADVDGDTPLLWVLRDVLGMTGTKFGCGMALCGACTVHVDGVAARSCVTPIDSIGTSEITTIEAIGATAAGAKIQKAWLDREVPQCGYCQSGHVGCRTSGKQSASGRFRYRRRHVRQYLPLRDLSPRPRCDQAGRCELTGRQS